MKKPKSEAVVTQLDPNHPNHDAILLKRNRLEAHRRNRLENRSGLLAQDLKIASGKSAKKPARTRED